MSYLKHTHALRESDMTHKVKVLDADIMVHDYCTLRGERLTLKAHNSSKVMTHFSLLPKDWMRPPEGASSREEYESSRVIHDAVAQDIYFKREVMAEIDGVKYKFTGTSAQYEKKTIPDSVLVPDVTFYDDNGGILCIIEVVVTHPCEWDKVRELKDKNILTIEKYYDNTGKKRKEDKIFGSKEFKEFRKSNRKIGEIGDKIIRITGERNEIKRENRRERDRVERKKIDKIIRITGEANQVKRNIRDIEIKRLGLPKQRERDIRDQNIRIEGERIRIKQSINKLHEAIQRDEDVCTKSFNEFIKTEKQYLRGEFQRMAIESEDRKKKEIFGQEILNKKRDNENSKEHAKILEKESDSVRKFFKAEEAKIRESYGFGAYELTLEEFDLNWVYNEKVRLRKTSSDVMTV